MSVAGDREMKAPAAPARHHALLLGTGAVLLVIGTVLVFRAFDAHSHSASDTLRPFAITMAPVWIVAVGAARVLLRERRP